MQFLIILSILTSGLYGMIIHSNKQLREAEITGRTHMALAYYEAIYFTHTFMS